jgi:hypothetical protein
MARPKPVIVGLFNPYSADPALALAPHTKQSTTGGRLKKMLSDVDPDYGSKYMTIFERHNLFRSLTQFKMKDLARTRADAILRNLDPKTTIILLGEEVRQAFSDAAGQEIEKTFLHPQRIAGVRMRVIPHPSGRCHHYNQEINRRLVGMMMADLCDEWVGRT